MVKRAKLAVNRSYPRSIELFTGAGGLALGTHKARFRHQALVEWNKDARETLRVNARRRSLRGISNWTLIGEDIREVDFSRFRGVDLVAGGPPCQPFSIGGKHGGRNDQRDMIPQFIRALKEIRPRAFIFENVKGLTRQAFQNYLSYIQLQMTYPEVGKEADEEWANHLGRLEDLHTEGIGRPQYNIVTRLLNAADYGVPQTRQRVFIVGFRADLGVDWHFPNPTHSRESLLHEQWVSSEYWEKHRVKKPPIPDRLKKTVARMPRLLAPGPNAWVTLRDAIHDLPAPLEGEDSSDYLNHRLQPGARSYVGHTGSPLDYPAKTLKAGVHGVPGGENMIAFSDGSVRYLTVREAARVQTFPDSWRFAGAWSETMRQLGNAVPCLLAEKVARSVADRLRKADLEQVVRSA